VPRSPGWPGSWSPPRRTWPATDAVRSSGGAPGSTRASRPAERSSAAGPARVAGRLYGRPGPDPAPDRQRRPSCRSGTALVRPRAARCAHPHAAPLAPRPAAKPATFWQVSGSGDDLRGGPLAHRACPRWSAAACRGSRRNGWAGPAAAGSTTSASGTPAPSRPVATAGPALRLPVLARSDLPFHGETVATAGPALRLPVMSRGSTLSLPDNCVATAGPALRLP